MRELSKIVFIVHFTLVHLDCFVYLVQNKARYLTYNIHTKSRKGDQRI